MAAATTALEVGLTATPTGVAMASVKAVASTMAAVASTGDGAPALAAAGGAVESGALAQVLAPLAPAQRLAHVEGAVLRVVRELAGGGAATVAGETPLMEAGVDSLAATELASRLRLSTGVALSPTVVFEHPSACAVAVHVVEQVVVEQLAAARQGAVVRRVGRAAGGVMVRKAAMARATCISGVGGQKGPHQCETVETGA